MPRAVLPIACAQSSTKRGDVKRFPQRLEARCDDPERWHPDNTGGLIARGGIDRRRIEPEIVERYITEQHLEARLPDCNRKRMVAVYAGRTTPRRAVIVLSAWRRTYMPHVADPKNLMFFKPSVSPRAAANRFPGAATRFLPIPALMSLNISGVAAIGTMRAIVQTFPALIITIGECFPRGKPIGSAASILRPDAMSFFSIVATVYVFSECGSIVPS